MTITAVKRDKMTLDKNYVGVYSSDPWFIRPGTYVKYT